MNIQPRFTLVDALGIDVPLDLHYTYWVKYRLSFRGVFLEDYFPAFFVSVLVYFFDNGPEKLFLLWLLNRLVKMCGIFVRIGKISQLVRHIFLPEVVFLYHLIVLIILFCGVFCITQIDLLFLDFNF